MSARNGEISRDPTEDAAPAEAAATEPSATPKEREAQGKRRLGMMPEVLPAPSNHPLQGSPRQRTVRTMERLLTAAAASALIAGCSNNKSGGDPGYGVVDPMPPPARCPGVAASIQVTAAWKQGNDGLIVEIRLSKPTRPDASFTAGEAPSVSTGKLVSSTVNDGAMVVEFAPDKGATFVYVTVGATCSEGTSHVAMQLDLTTTSTAPPKAEDPVRLTLNDSY